MLVVIRGEHTHRGARLVPLRLRRTQLRHCRRRGRRRNLPRGTGLLLGPLLLGQPLLQQLHLVLHALHIEVRLAALQLRTDDLGRRLVRPLCPPHRLGRLLLRSLQCLRAISQKLRKLQPLALRRLRGRLNRRGGLPRLLPRDLLRRHRRLQSRPQRGQLGTLCLQLRF